jgi:hypothetical protein
MEPSIVMSGVPFPSPMEQSQYRKAHLLTLRLMVSGTMYPSRCHNSTHFLRRSVVVVVYSSR